MKYAAIAIVVGKLTLWYYPGHACSDHLPVRFQKKVRLVLYRYDLPDVFIDHFIRRQPIKRCKVRINEQEIPIKVLCKNGLGYQVNDHSEVCFGLRQRQFRFFYTSFVMRNTIEPNSDAIDI